MKNFDSFEDFGYQKIDEAATSAPFYDSVSQMNAILASDDVASKMEMMFIDSMTYAENNTWILKSKDRQMFSLKVTLKANGQEYAVSKVDKVYAMP